MAAERWISCKESAGVNHDATRLDPGAPSYPRRRFLSSPFFV